MKLINVLISSLSLLLIGCGGEGSDDDSNNNGEEQPLVVSAYTPLVTLTSELDPIMGDFNLSIEHHANIPNTNWIGTLTLFKRQTDPILIPQESILGTGWSLNAVNNDPTLWTNIRCIPTLYAGNTVRFSCRPTDPALASIAPQNLELDATLHETVVAYYSFASFDPDITETYTDTGKGDLISHELFTIKTPILISSAIF